MSDETQTPETEDSVNADAEAVSENTVEIDPKDARIAELEAEVAQVKDQLLRALAETENVRKRSAREVSDAAAYGIEKFAKDMLSVSDNLTRALAALNDDGTSGAIRTGAQPAGRRGNDPKGSACCVVAQSRHSGRCRTGRVI